MSDEKREWLVRKGGYFYRPNGAGYTTRKIEAGRYTKAEAVLEAAVEPLHMTVLHESEIPDEPAISAPPASGWSPAMTELDKDALDAAARAIAGGGSLRDAIRAYLDAADDWRPIETAPAQGEFLAYGSYLYEGDKHLTKYMMIAERSQSKEYPWESCEGLHAPSFFSRWRPLPSTPKEGE